MMLFKDDSKKSLWNLSIIGLYIILIYLPDITRYKNIVMGLIGATALWYLVRDFRTIGQIFKNNLAYALFFLLLAIGYSVVISVEPVLIKAAEKEGITNFPIHVKLDTGMHRLGFSVDEIPLLIRRLRSQNAVIPRSVFSHFVGSDSAQFDFFTRQQIELFEKGSQELQEAFSHKILRHICNTAGIERFPGAQFDMVRLGIGLYGVSPIDNSIINNVSTLKTTILQIRDVPGEDTVGYSRMGHLTRPSRIAAIPIGYADGLNRHLGRGNAYCLVNGKKAPYVGNICMDVCMIDVTDIDCREGDKAVIFGDDLPITKLSDKLGTIPYEVLTSISNRVKRVYYQD